MKKIILKTLEKLGYRISKINSKSKPSIGFNQAYLSSICDPDIVIDVGVGYGTHSLYKAYPKATLMLVEPLIAEYSEAIDKIKVNYSCEVFGCALGESKGEMQLNFDINNLQKASLFERTGLTKNEGSITTKSVEVTTLDNILDSKELANKKVILKIDTEGGELSVLKGGMSSIRQIDFIIAEVSLAKRFESSYEFEDLIEFMSTNGFKVFSFLTMSFPSKEPRQRFTDILFKNTTKNH